MNWAEAIPLASVLVISAAAGAMVVTVKGIRIAVDELNRRGEKSAEGQGKRIGDLESWQVAHMTEHAVLEKLREKKR